MLRIFLLRGKLIKAEGKSIKTLSRISLLIFLSFQALAKEEICPTVTVHGDEKINLSTTERRLLCGDNEEEAYANIPDYQAALFMQGFLQSRGFLQPRFETKDGVLNVYMGKKSSLRAIKINSNLPKEERVIRRDIERLFLRRTLTPGLLNDIEKESKHNLRRRGYPCVEINSEANAIEREVDITFSKTIFHPFGDVKKEEIPELHPNALVRYYPYEAEDDFDERLLELNEKRMMRSEVVQGAYYLENCSPDGSEFSLEQRFLVGPPRTLRFGVGASTELGPMARVMWSNNRYGPMASVLSARIQGSIRAQTLSLMADSFIWKDSPRRSLVSEFNITRESQMDYEQSLLKVMPAAIKWTRDVDERGWTWLLGASYEVGNYLANDNSETRSFSTGVIEGAYTLMAHNYELFDVHPEEGDVFNFRFSFRHPSLGFSDSALKLDANYVILGRFGQMGRGELIGGARLSAGTLVISDDVDLDNLPPAVKFYGGGSDDIRGFGLSTLPRNDGVGGITRTSLKLEARKTHFLHDSLEGFVFVDGAYFGYESFSTTSELFYSPGLGIRWVSPIGIVQGYWARAYTASPNDDKGNFFYAGLGGIF